MHCIMFVAKYEKILDFYKQMIFFLWILIDIDEEFSYIGFYGTLVCTCYF